LSPDESDTIETIYQIVLPMREAQTVDTLMHSEDEEVSESGAVRADGRGC
jgi:hypothetical protein